MSTKRQTRVLVVGGGPAALAAAARVLERGGRERFDVRLVTQGHHFGGKASSWRDGEGRLIDHGQHVIIGWYHEMKALLRRAGVDVEAHLVGNGGHSHVYEPRDGKVHDLALVRNPIHMLARGLGYSGLTAAEKRNIAWFVLSNLWLFLGLQDLEPFDDVCFTAFCLANGLRASIVRTSAFRMARTAQLNWPREISAYSMLRATRMLGRDYRTSSYAFCDGGMSERFWEPILAYVARLGCRVEIMRKLTALAIEGGRVTGATFAEPHSAGHDDPAHPAGAPRFAGTIPTKPGTERTERDFDYLISALPCTAFQELNPGDTTFWSIPELSRLRNLRGVRPFALQLWHRERLTRHYRGALGGLDGPLGYVIDNKHIIREYRENPRYGAVLYFVGQETGYEDWSDEQHLALCLANVARLPGFERIDRAGIVHYQVVRHHAPDKLYFLTEPGVQKFRPHSRTSIPNLMLAGDWVRSEIDFPCMEAAIRSGRAAADLVVEAAA
jgi:15-cis-phytoene desaturase